MDLMCSMSMFVLCSSSCHTMISWRRISSRCYCIFRILQLKIGQNKMWRSFYLRRRSKEVWWGLGSFSSHFSKKLAFDLFLENRKNDCTADYFFPVFLVVFLADFFVDFTIFCSSIRNARRMLFNHLHLTHSPITNTFMAQISAISTSYRTLRYAQSSHITTRDTRNLS